jgi:hypothetical protein
MPERKIGYPVVKPTSAVQDWTAVAQNTIVKSAEIDLINAYKAIMHVQAALDTTTAHTGTRFLVQISGSETGDEDWQTHTDFVALIGTAATDLIENDPLAAGATSITLTSHALTVEGIWLLIEDGTLANSELIFESASATNAITVLDGTTNAHAVSTAIFNVAMVQNITLPGSAVRARLVVDNTYDDNGSTLNYKVRASIVLGQ